MSNGFGFGFARATREYFSPRSLFVAGEVGTWYDPSDLSTLYQDSAGTTPVTAVEQPVGLMLDKSQGLALGSELVTNGTFDTDVSGWSNTTNATTAFDSGQAHVTISAASNGSAQLISGLTVGRSYRFSGTARKGTNANEADIRIVTLAGVLVANLRVTSTEDTNVSGVFVATETSHYIRMQFSASAYPASGYFDNISVKELPGNHAFQSTSASRPTLSARVNLLTKTEDFSDAAWTKLNCTATANAVLAPDGTTTADVLTDDATNGAHSFDRVSTTSSGISYTFSVFAKANTLTKVVVTLDGNNSVANASFDLSLGTVATVYSGSASIVDHGNGWYRCTVTGTTVNTAPYLRIRAVDAAGSASYAGTGQSLYIWGADLRATNDGSNLPAYQRVNTSTDYDTSGFPLYLKFDGADDSLATNTITPGTDKVQVFGGVRKLSDATGVVAELGTSVSADNGSNLLIIGDATIADSFFHRGTITRGARWFARTLAPASLVYTGISDLGGDSVLLRANGTQVASDAGDPGTGNYLAYPLYIGRRGGSSLPFNGRLYQLITRFGPNLTDTQIQNTERYTNRKTKAY